MNMQGLQYTSSPKNIARPLCLCEDPVIDLDDLKDPSSICNACGKKMSLSAMKAAKKMMLMKELREIEEAKTNIRNTLRLQQKRNSNRAEELEFLLKRL